MAAEKAANPPPPMSIAVGPALADRMAPVAKPEIRALGRSFLPLTFSKVHSMVEYRPPAKKELRVKGDGASERAKSVRAIQGDG